MASKILVGLMIAPFVLGFVAAVIPLIPWFVVVAGLAVICEELGL